MQATIAKSPSTEAVSTESLKVQQPFLVDLTTFGKAMTPATASLNEALPAFVPAIEAGTRDSDAHAVAERRICSR